MILKEVIQKGIVSKQENWLLPYRKVSVSMIKNYYCSYLQSSFGALMVFSVRRLYIIIKRRQIIYDMNFFDSKEGIFKRRSFLKDVKQIYTDLINQLVKEENEKLSVFDAEGPYLATKKIGKNNPKAEVIKADNDAKQEWNRTVDEALAAGVLPDDVLTTKKDNISTEVKKSIRKYGEKPGLLSQIIAKAVKVLKEKIQLFVEPQKPELKVDMQVFQRMQQLRKSLWKIQKNIRRIDDQIQTKQKQLDELTGLSGAFRMKEKKELMNFISNLLNERTKQSELLKEKVTKAGYHSVDSFMRAFHRSEMMVEAYLRTEISESNKDKNPGRDSKERQSVLKKLHQYDEEAKRNNCSCKCRTNVSRKSSELEC